MRVTRLVMIALALSAACAHAPPSPVTWKQIDAMTASPADHVIPYGEDSLAFGELRLPEGRGPHPVVVLVHGGCWRAQYDLRHVAPMAEALTRKGVAVWTIEYRRIGDPGGGWPGTFEDVARGTDHVRALAGRFPLDLARVVLMGHSAGGHLALWAAGRGAGEDGAIASADPLDVRGVVGLAAITDLRAYAAGTEWCNASVPLLLGGGPDEVPERYRQASPAERPPLRVTLRLLHGTADDVVPLAQSRDFVERAETGGDVRLVVIEGAGHFDLIAPTSRAWPEVERAVLELGAPTPKR